MQTHSKILFTLSSLLIFALATGSGGATAQPTQVSLLNETLNQPWSLAQLPDGDLLITEKPGRLLRRDQAGELHPISGVPEVFLASQGGLLEVLPDPKFAENRQIYLSFAAGDIRSNRTTVIRATLEQDALSEVSTLLEVSPDKSKAAHYGGKLAFMADGTLLVSVGEGFEFREQAQSLDSELGKILRIHTDGSAPADNPFAATAPRVWSYGHRNPQGLAVDPASQTVWMHEHGPRGGDELNRVEPGTNYGWPAITYGVDYSGALISPYQEAEGMAQPVTWWVPSIAPSGLAIYRGAMFPEWDGDLLVGALVDRALYRLDMSAGQVVSQSVVNDAIEGRVRDVRVLANGAIAAVTDGGRLYLIERGEGN